MNTVSILRATRTICLPGADIRSFFPGALVLLLFLAGGARAAAEQSRSVIVGGDSNYAPYEFLDEQGRPTGYNVELTRAIAHVMDMEVEIRLGPWAEAREGLVGGSLDAIHGMFYSPERDRGFDFSPPHTTVNHAVFVREGGPDIRSVDDLKEREIVVMRGDIMEDYANEQGLTERLIRVASQADALRLLASGKHDCALVAALPGRYWIRELGLDNLRTVGPILRPSHYCYAVREGDTDLLSRFSEGLSILKQTGKYQPIYDKWLGVLEPKPLSREFVLKLIAAVLLPALLVFVAILVWVATLRREVRRRTRALENEVVERRRAEESLRESEARHRAYIENSPNGIFVADREGRYLEANEAACRLTGYSRQELQGMKITDILASGSIEAGRAHLASLVADGRAAGDVEGRRKDGSTYYMHVSAARLGEDRFIAFCSDITERRKAEEEHRQSHRQLLSIFDGIDEIVYVADPETDTVLYANEKARRSFGEDVVGQRCYRAIYGRLAPCEFCTNDMILDENLGRTYVWESHNERTGRWYRCIDKAIEWPDGRWARYEMAIDITSARRAEEERRSLEQRIQQAQKLESLGVLAGGIAHDFNNLLMTILGNADLALQDISPANPARESVREIEHAGRRAADLCKQMLAYSGKGKFVISTLDINEVVREMTHMLEVSVSKKAVLRFNLAPNLPAVRADATQLRQILMNLVVNASDAIGDQSGVITVSSGAMECDRAYLSEIFLDADLPEGVYAYFEVADTGCGMDEETRRRIFDPFFTTKFTGRGLGLAAALGIIRSHKGALKVYSEPGRGATFKALLPAVDEAPEALENDIEHEPEWKGSGTVLIVDDDETIRTLGRRMLERVGFDVLVAGDGREALEIVRENPEGIDCVLLDLTMPHMDGEETYRELRRLRSDLRVIMSSGYNEQEVTRRFIGKGLAGFIQKPYQSRQLIEALRRVFDPPI